MKLHRYRSIGKLLGPCLLFVVGVCQTNGAEMLLPTMSFGRPEHLVVADRPLDIGSHVATRTFDVDADGDLDLLLGGGDGRLWLSRNETSGKAVRFAQREPIVAGTRQKWGDSYTGVVLANLIGNELLDLVVSHSGNQVSIHENTGSATNPSFKENASTFTVQENCQGRFDVADWNGDNLPDLITGSFSGALSWHPNLGTPEQPSFEEGIPFQNIAVAYNSHPRMIDFNQDGKLDLLLGVNWGSVSVYLNEGTLDAPSLSGGRQVQWADDGSNLSLRELNGDDTTPELVDLDRDGTLDLLSGGNNGRVFWMRGIGPFSRVTTFQNALKRFGDQLGPRLSVDDQLRKTVFGALTAIQADLAAGLIPPLAREDLFGQLAALAKEYPAVFQRQQFDLQASPFSPSLAAQFWVVLLESLPDSKANRARVADALNFQGGYRRLLTDLGVIFIDNDTASSEQLMAMHRLMMAIPNSVWDVETITVAGWLGAGFREQGLRSRSGVNIFDMPLGRPENSFANDSPRPGITDVYMICLAHELAHNMLDTVGRRLRPDLYEMKFEGLAQAAGPLVAYRSPKSLGIDLATTKERFQKAGHWDGREESWRKSWNDYFRDKPEFDRAYCRGNIQFFLDSPQEAFATLANQYFADSQLMLEFCKARWDAGHPSNVNQFLLIADYLSNQANHVNFYLMRTGGNLKVTSARLRRDDQGRIVEVRSEKTTASFRFDSQNLVTDFVLEPTGS